MRTKCIVCTLAASLLLLAPQFATAGSIIASFNSVVDGHTVNTNLGSTNAGYMKWQVNSVPNSSGLPSGLSAGSNFYGFCIQWGEYTGNNVAFGVTSALQTAPQGSPPANAMGAGAASALNRLFDKHFVPYVNNTNKFGADQATAFQLAVWEIVYEGVKNTGLGNPNTNPVLDLTSGAFTSTTGANNARTIAQGWLQNLWSGSVSKNYGVYALTSPDPNGFQDQVIGVLVNGGGDPNVTVPEPATVSLLAVSGVGALAFRVRRRPRKLNAN